MAPHDAVELVIEPRVRPVGNGEVRRLLPYRTRRMVGPFIFADVMGPEDLDPGAAMNVNAHPHIGLSTLTYLLQGRAVHRDSTGAVQTIEAGAVNWMTAGDGVTHTERSHPDDVDQTTAMFGLQTWVALPDDAEDGPATFEHCARADVPRLAFGASEVAVAAGTGWGETSPVPGSSPLLLAELRIDHDPVPVDVRHRERAVLAMDGDLRVGDRPLAAGHLAVLDADVPATVSGTGTAMVLAGDPLGPRRIWWNFVHSDEERIEEAKQRWLDQSFPTVPGDHEPFVPLPSAGG